MSKGLLSGSEPNRVVNPDPTVNRQGFSDRAADQKSWLDEVRSRGSASVEALNCDGRGEDWDGANFGADLMLEFF